METYIDQIKSYVVEFAPNVIFALVILIIGKIVAKKNFKVLWEGFKKEQC